PILRLCCEAINDLLFTVAFPLFPSVDRYLGALVNDLQRLGLLVGISAAWPNLSSATRRKLAAQAETAVSAGHRKPSRFAR
ncbi:MAG TPA: hypothetical protein VFG04_18695, partial [Planctomycetaceae bacterium]|nr:hypothetical protein [Planctomycetaceae bacterium]